ncbi:ABC-F family ATP-binding cassette domain-containing protein [Candidatus Roizmanbacteria bacterium]|nr:ABC-F family ATP-binding cassette domain-containing protein [Candidatus Roizmanbacteria bacterium]
METIIRFNGVSFAFENKIILDEVSFSVRKGMKVALMGQNGAGKSTLFKLLTRKLRPDSGEIIVDKKLTVATAHQVISPDDMELTMEDYFRTCCDVELYELRRRMSNVLDAVNLQAPGDKIIKSFSGGQQARLLLASALIQDPDLLLLDEPTNNLDHAGIDHLTQFLVNYKKSVVVISHDAEFLNTFTQGVLYLDSFKKKIEQYAGDYYDVVEEIAVRIEKERRQNAQMERGIQENKDKANFFANKGGKMRNVAKKMREKVEKMESEKVEVRKEDKTIPNFVIPVQENISHLTLKIHSYTIMQNYSLVSKSANVFLSKNNHLLIVGPNGIGKSTLIQKLATGEAEGLSITPGVRIGYYSQNFSTLDFEDTVYECLAKALVISDGALNEGYLRSVAARFLITSDLINTQIKFLSEGQKGLVSFARLVLLKPGVLILDEPTNHINFRHLPIIAKALSDFRSVMILVSHVPEFVSQIRIDQILNLEK